MTAPSRRLFGTDGIRGIANHAPVTPENAFRLGRALGYFVTAKKTSPEQKQAAHVVIGRDTRRSGPMLEAALAAGLNSIGATTYLAGILPTPAVALLTREEKADAGVVISASHNPAEDNGLKLFRGDGYKFDDTDEARIEELILTPAIDELRPIGADIGTTHQLTDSIDRYVETCKKSVPSLSLSGITIAVDAANGAASVTTPRILKELGASVQLFHSSPDGMNINDGCGSTYDQEISRLRRKTKATIGLAHDGDADRLLLCDEEGSVVDGDEILAMIALDALRSGTLSNNTLVTTVMSNFGLDECIAAAGGKVIRTGVGDRYVIEAMLLGNFNIGGEQSGHLIFRDHSTTGDGIIAALQVLQLMMKTKLPLSELRRCLKKYPQAQRNLRVKEKLPIASLPSVTALINKIEQSLQGKGRILLRYSGTEPLLRLLIEGRDEKLIHQQCDEISAALMKALGESGS